MLGAGGSVELTVRLASPGHLGSQTLIVSGSSLVKWGLEKVASWVLLGSNDLWLHMFNYQSLESVPESEAAEAEGLNCVYVFSMSLLVGFHSKFWEIKA